MQFDPSKMDSAGTITFASADNLITGEPVTYSSNGGTAIGGLTSGATYYAIVTAPDQIRLADTAADALLGNSLPDLNPAGAGSDQTITPDSLINSSGSVTLESTAEDDAEGEAEYYGQVGRSDYGFAIGVGIGVPTATTTVQSGSIIDASQTVSVTTNATATTKTTAEVGSNTRARRSSVPTRQLRRERSSRSPWA